MKTRPSSLAVKSNAVKLIVLAALSTWMFNLGAIAHADEDSPPPPPPPAKSGGAKATGDKKKTNIDFEDELVEGELKKPELFYLLQKKQFNFKRLIKLREDFLPEMRRDSDEIRRGRSKN
jgi:hypothetical protein